MDGIRQYILSVVAAAVLCAVIRTMASGKGTAASLIRLVSGIFLAFVVMAPVAHLELEALPTVLMLDSQEAAEAAALGENIARDAAGDIIKQQTEAYILDKAEALGLELTVEVTLSGGELPTPAAVRIRGSASPYARAALQAMLEEELGISKENQLWTG